VTQYVALSGHLRDYLVDGVGIAARRVERICNGVDTERFSPRRTPVSQLAECPFVGSDLRLIGTVGRLQAVKDQVNLARAFALLTARNPDAKATARLVVVGDGPLRREVEEILQGSGVRELAWLPGERADVPDVLRALDLFVLPSLAEGISNSILEAMSTGLPVVATDVGGNCELVQHGVTGRLVPAADPVALADALLAYLRDPATAREHGAAGRGRAEREFSLHRMIADYDHLYSRLLDARGIRSPSLTRA
jgi:sugar transferase (PEP-CTERM/EpsH1 system associated)